MSKCVQILESLTGICERFARTCKSEFEFIAEEISKDFSNLNGFYYSGSNSPVLTKKKNLFTVEFTGNWIFVFWQN